MAAKRMAIGVCLSVVCALICAACLAFGQRRGAMNINMRVDPKPEHRESARERYITMSRDGHALARIVVGTHADAVVRHAARALQQQFEIRTGIRLPIREQPNQGSEPATILLWTGRSNTAGVSALAALGAAPSDAKQPGIEGFQLRTGRSHDQAYVLLNGADPLGTLHAAGWFLRRIRFRDRFADIEAGIRLSTAPATEMRRIRFGDHLGYVNTELSGWEEIWTDYALWGLSAVTMRCDPAHQGDPRESQLARYLWDKWAKRVGLARTLGLKVVHLTQTNLTSKDGEFGPKRVPDFARLNYLCPDFNGVNPTVPGGMDLILRSRKWFFDNMPDADKVDYFLTSGWDGGGCTDPRAAPWSVTYAGIVDKLYPFMRQHNPDARVILGLYAVPDIEALARKLTAGWQPEWLYAVEFDQRQFQFAELFPDRYRRQAFIHQTTIIAGGYQGYGANPTPLAANALFEDAFRQGIRDGLGCYSEGTHDFVNQILLMQKAWDPDKPVDAILDEICTYYFGYRAAPYVKHLLYLLEKEDVSNPANPVVNPEATVYVRSAQRVMPKWARESRQWAQLVGRVALDRMKRRQADLLPLLDRSIGRLRALRGQPLDAPTRVDVREAVHNLQALVRNARDMEKVYNVLSRRGFRVQGGSQLQQWPSERTAAAILELARWKRGDRAAPWGAGYVDAQGHVAAYDGWGNIRTLANPLPTDACLQIADLDGQGYGCIVFRSGQALYVWDVAASQARLLASGDFLTGPLAAGDMDGDKRDELVVLCGQDWSHPHLSVVTAAGRIQDIPAVPGGTKPDMADTALTLDPPAMIRAVDGPYQPRVILADVEGNGRKEIVFADRNNDARLTVMDIAGRTRHVGPMSAAGALAAGDLDGDGKAEIVYAPSEGALQIWFPARPSAHLPGAIRCSFEGISVIASQGKAAPILIYADPAHHLCAVDMHGVSRQLSDLPISTVVAPGLAAGDYNADGRVEVMYACRRLMFTYPLMALCRMTASGDMRQDERVLAPLGPRCSGLLRFVY